jgi:hypothetical protein
VVNFVTDRIECNRVLFYTQNTGIPVNTIAPEFPLSALEARQNVREKFFIQSATGSPNGGIREKHYTPSVRSRQKRLDADLASAWNRDPLLLLRSGIHQRYAETGYRRHNNSFIFE